MDTRQFPVETVSWDEATSYCRQLNKSFPQPVWRFDLPTEAQWEYACRAGTTTPFHFGKLLNGTQANCDGTLPYGTLEKGAYLKRPCQVGRSKPNAWGLYDMYGNVEEWCRDWFGEEYMGKKREDPLGPVNGKSRICRGGVWAGQAEFCRAASRSGLLPGIRWDLTGFRVALVPVAKK